MSEARPKTHPTIIRQLSRESLQLPHPLDQNRRNLLFPNFQVAVFAFMDGGLGASHSLSKSDMPHPSDDIASNLNPIDTRVQFFIHEPTNRYIFSSYDIQAVSNLGAGLGVVVWAYDALDSLA